MSGLSHTPGKRARGKTLRGFESRLIRQKKNGPVAQCVTGLFLWYWSSVIAHYFGSCVIFMAEPIKAATSLILLGTIKVVVASAATLE